MQLEIKNKRTEGGTIDPLYNYLLPLDDSCTFTYMGLTVEIDPSVDFQNQNILVRWTDVEEGFNDKTIYYSLEDFRKDFQLIDN